MATKERVDIARQAIDKALTMIVDDKGQLKLEGVYVGVFIQRPITDGYRNT